MERVIALISVIQTPQTDKAFFQQTQREIQAVQKSEDGWELAKALLSVPDASTQFIGAQTFLVQLNEKTALPNLDEMKSDLLKSLEHAVLLNYAPFVVRKLVACIVKLFYMLEPQEWEDCFAQTTKSLSPELCFEFYQILVEDSELDSAQTRTRLEPYFSLISAALEQNLATEMGVKVYCLYASHFFPEFKHVLPAFLTLLTNEDGVNFVAPAVSELFQLHGAKWPAASKQLLGEVLGQYVCNWARNGSLSEASNSDAFDCISELVVDVCSENFTEYVELHQFLLLLAGMNVPVVEDSLAFPVLGFWNQYVDEIISSGMASSANAVIAQVISSYWPRVKLYSSLSSTDLNEFNAFRVEFADFLELAYQLVGAHMVEDLVSIVLNSLNANPVDWYSVESGLYCLNSLSDIINGYASVKPIFASELWTKLNECNVARVRQTAVNAIGCYVDFFTTETMFLASTLNFLFSSLEITATQLPASKSIQKLCKQCRSQLVSELPAFIAVYSNMRAVLEPVCHTRVVNGIGCVIEAVTDLNLKMEGVSRIIELVMTCSYPEDEASIKLQCLAAIGKSQQSENTVNLNDGSLLAEFYASNPLALQTHARLEEWLYAVDVTDASALEHACEVIKTGLPELAGVFVFNSAFIVRFIAEKMPSEAGKPALLDLARFLVCTSLFKLKEKSSAGLSLPELEALVSVAFLSGEVSPSLDLVAEIVKTLQYKGMAINTVPGVVESVCNLAIPGLNSSDRFVFRSSVAVLKEILLPRSELDAELLQQLLITILNLVCGQVPRSDLASVSDLIKLLVARHQMQTSACLDQLVRNPCNQVLAQLNEKTRTDFIAQLMLVKGGRKTQEIVQKFWQKCRGIPDTYSPLKSLHTQ